MLDTVKINHVQHISFTQSRLTDAVSVILSELLSYEHPSNSLGAFLVFDGDALLLTRPGRRSIALRARAALSLVSFFATHGVAFKAVRLRLTNRQLFEKSWTKNFHALRDIHF